MDKETLDLIEKLMAQKIISMNQMASAYRRNEADKKIREIREALLTNPRGAT